MLAIEVNKKNIFQPMVATIYPEIAGNTDLDKPIIEVKNEYCVALNLQWKIEAI